MSGPIARGMTEICRAFAAAGLALDGGHLHTRIEYEQKVSTLRVLVGDETQAYLDIADGDPAVALELASAGGHCCGRRRTESGGIPRAGHLPHVPVHRTDPVLGHTEPGEYSPS